MGLHGQSRLTEGRPDPHVDDAGVPPGLGLEAPSVDAAGVTTTAMQFPGGAPLTLFAVYEGDATYAGSESNHIPQVLAAQAVP